MFDFAKKGLYVGLGLANLTKEKIEDVAKDIADKAKLGEEEGKRVAEYLQSESDKAGESLKGSIDSMIKNAVAKLPCVSCRNHVKALEERIAVLEAKLGIEPAPVSGEDCCCGFGQEPAAEEECCCGFGEDPVKDETKEEK